MNMTRLRWFLASLTLLAAAALTSPPYQMTTVFNGNVIARLNVWTGKIDFCVPETGPAENPGMVCHKSAFRGSAAAQSATEVLPPGFEVVDTEPAS